MSLYEDAVLILNTFNIDYSFMYETSDAFSFKNQQPLPFQQTPIITPVI